MKTTGEKIISEIESSLSHLPQFCNYTIVLHVPPYYFILKTIVELFLKLFDFLKFLYLTIEDLRRYQRKIFKTRNPVHRLNSIQSKRRRVYSWIRVPS